MNIFDYFKNRQMNKWQTKMKLKHPNCIILTSNKISDEKMYQIEQLKKKDDFKAFLAMDYGICISAIEVTKVVIEKYNLFRRQNRINELCQ